MRGSGIPTRGNHNDIECAEIIYSDLEWAPPPRALIKVVHGQQSISTDGPRIEPFVLRSLGSLILVGGIGSILIWVT